MKHFFLIIILLGIFIDVFAQTTDEKVMVQMGTVFRYRSNNHDLSQNTRLGLSLAVSHFFPLNENKKFGIRTELMGEATYNSVGKMNYRDIDGISAGQSSINMREYTATPAALAEIHVFPWLNLGTGLSMPITLLHYTPVMVASAAIDGGSRNVRVTSYHKLGVNLPVYIGFNLSKRIALGLRLDQGLSNRKKTSIPGLHQYDTNFRFLFGFKF